MNALLIEAMVGLFTLAFRKTAKLFIKHQIYF